MSYIFKFENNYENKNLNIIKNSCKSMREKAITRLCIHTTNEHRTHSLIKD